VMSPKLAQAPKSGKQVKSFDNDASHAALLEFDDLCRANGLTFFLVSGTFLGVVRDGKFIGHDHDIDLGVFADKPVVERLLSALSKAQNFSLIKAERILLRKVDDGVLEYRLMDLPAIIKLVHRDGVAIDVFVHFIDGDAAWHGAGIHRWDNMQFELGDYPFLGRTFKGAADAELYLTENYGPNWRVPKSDFDSNTDTPNLRFAGSANALVFWAWMVARAADEANWGRAQQYLELLMRLGVLEEHLSGLRVAARPHIGQGVA